MDYLGKKPPMPVNKHLSGRHNQKKHAHTFRNVGAVLGGIQGAISGGEIVGATMLPLNLATEAGELTLRKLDEKEDGNGPRGSESEEETSGFISAAELGLRDTEDITPLPTQLEVEDIQSRAVNRTLMPVLFGAGAGGVVGTAFGAAAGDRLDKILSQPEKYKDKPHHFENIGTVAGGVLGGLSGADTGSKFGTSLAKIFIEYASPEKLINAKTLEYDASLILDMDPDALPTKELLSGSAVGAVGGMIGGAAGGAFIGKQIGKKIDKELARLRNETPIIHKHLAGQHDQQRHAKTSSKTHRRLSAARSLAAKIAVASKKRDDLKRLQTVYDALATATTTLAWTLPPTMTITMPAFVVSTAGSLWTRKRLEDIRDDLDRLNASLDRLDLEEHLGIEKSYKSVELQILQMADDAKDPLVKEIFEKLSTTASKMSRVLEGSEEVVSKHLAGQHDQQRHASGASSGSSDKLSSAVAWLSRNRHVVKGAQIALLGAITTGYSLYKKYVKYQSRAKQAVIDSNANNIRGFLGMRAKTPAQKAWKAAASGFIDNYQKKFSIVDVPRPKGVKEYIFSSPEIESAKRRNKEADELISNPKIIDTYLRDSILFYEQGKTLFSNDSVEKHLAGQHDQLRHAGEESRALITVTPKPDSHDGDEDILSRQRSYLRLMNFLYASVPIATSGLLALDYVSRKYKKFRKSQAYVKSALIDANADKISSLLSLKAKTKDQAYWKEYASRYVDRYKAELKTPTDPVPASKFTDSFNPSSPIMTELKRRSDIERRRTDHRILDAELKESETLLASGLRIYGLQDLVKKHLAGQHDQLRHAGEGGDRSYRQTRASKEIALLEPRIKPLAAQYSRARKEYEATGDAEAGVKLAKFRALLMPLVAQRDAWNDYAKGGASRKCDRCGKDMPVALTKSYETYAGELSSCCGEFSVEEIDAIKVKREEESGLAPGQKLTGRSGIDWLREHDPEFKRFKPRSEDTLKIPGGEKWKEGDTIVRRTRKKYQSDDDDWLDADLSREKDRP